ncbi:MAG: heme exporter protein CcmD [Candidatus Methylomirabilia bacterium]
MPDNWGFVFAAYGIALVVLIGYWRRLTRRGRELARLKKQQERKGA